MRWAASGTLSQSVSTRSRSCTFSVYANALVAFSEASQAETSAHRSFSGRMPVVGDLDGRPARRHQGAVAVDLLREAGVQPGVLTGQQFVVDGLADQRVPEGVAAVGDLEHVAGHGGPDRVFEVRTPTGR